MRSNPVLDESRASESIDRTPATSSPGSGKLLDPREIEKRRRRIAREYELWAECHAYLFEHGRSETARMYWRRGAYVLKRQFLSHFFVNPPRWRLLLRKLGGRRMLPDFCLISPSKSGSSDLATSLMLHPNVMTPLVKEIWEPDPEAWRVYYPTERSASRHAMRTGMAFLPFVTPCLHELSIAWNLSRLRPGIRIVLSLRNPAERMYSHWKWEKFLAGRQVASKLPFLSTFSGYVDQALEIFPAHPGYSLIGVCPLQMGIYWKAVRYWLECFGAENVLISDIAEYFRDRDCYLRKVQGFLGMPYAQVTVSGSRVNENPVSFPPAEPETMMKLRKFFAPHNERLWEVIGRQLDW